MNKFAQIYLESFQKEAAPSLNQLRSIVREAKPLFHASQAPIKGNAVVTPVEAAMKGILTSVEGAAGTRRINAPKLNVNPVVSESGQVSVPFSDLLKNTIKDTFPEYKREMAGNAGRDLVDLGRSGPVGEYAKSMFLAPMGKYIGAKNWHTISTSERPMAAYGNYGLLTSPKRINYPIGRVNGGVVRAEVQVQPAWNSKTMAFDLPRAEGAKYYTPGKDSIEEGRRLKAEGYIPMSSKVMRRLKYLSKNTEDIPANNVESGNLGFRDMEKRYPSYQREIADAAPVTRKMMGYNE